MSDFEDPELQPSKTRRKQEALDQQALGEELTGLSQDKLTRLDLPERLLDAIEAFNRLPKSFGARKRQLQYIGKLMRDCDTEAIREQLQASEDPAAERHQKIENACENILARGDSAINDLLQEHPQLERKTLRQYVLAYQRSEDSARVAEAKKLRSYLLDNL